MLNNAYAFIINAKMFFILMQLHIFALQFFQSINHDCKVK